jgi:hypothetical protein
VPFAFVAAAVWGGRIFLNRIVGTSAEGAARDCCDGSLDPWGSILATNKDFSCIALTENEASTTPPPNPQI